MVAAASPVNTVPDKTAERVCSAKTVQTSYVTKAPPSFKQAYQLQKGLLIGTGTVTWNADVSHYEMKLEGSVAIVGNVLTQTSSGSITPQGLAPRQHTDQRLNKEARSVTFNPNAKTITFSSSDKQYDLKSGSQDRLSWMMQLPAIAEGDVRQLMPGCRVQMFVAGSSGAADDWVFDVIGKETLRLAGQTLQTLHLKREPRHADDSQVEIWLDTNHHYKPVRALFAEEHQDPLDLRVR